MKSFTHQLFAKPVNRKTKIKPCSYMDNEISSLIYYSTGVVRVTSAFDYETTQTYDILIEVADQGTDPAAMSTTVLVTVVVTDINEATPV